MNDTQLRKIILGEYYKQRRGEYFTPQPEDFDPQIPMEDIFAISSQLGKLGLIDWKSLPHTASGVGKINSNGIDAVEMERNV